MDVNFYETTVPHRYSIGIPLLSQSTLLYEAASDGTKRCSYTVMMGQLRNFYGKQRDMGFHELISYFTFAHRAVTLYILESYNDVVVPASACKFPHLYYHPYIFCPIRIRKAIGIYGFDQTESPLSHLQKWFLITIVLKSSSYLMTFSHQNLYLTI